ncbi:MAG: hypothetical protein LC667_04815, partial [Thioalkalivibrio sp.]|nr:hypothetical protein [Thioalkalivibrio sp.]
MERIAEFGGKFGETPQFGQRVSQMVAVRVNDRNAHSITSAVEKDKVRAHPAPVVLPIPIRDGQRVFGSPG